MPTVSIRNFSRGKAHDYVNGRAGESSISKQFDILSFPQRLVPLAGLTTLSEPTDTQIGKMILAENGIMYAIGINPSGSNAELYKRTGYGTSDVWTDFTADQLSGGNLSSYNFLVHFPENDATVRTLFWSATDQLCVSDPADGGSTANTDTLAHSFIGQGLVHPKDVALYFPYKTTTQHYIGKIAQHASGEFVGKNYTAFELPNRYRSYCLSWYGDYLAIPMTTDSQAGTNRSVVGLWDRDVSLTTLNETIPWGDGKLKVLNNLKGVLIGISEYAGGQSVQQNQDKIEIKIWAGGPSPVTIKEIVAQRLDATEPVVQLNERVNYINNDRLYFSADITISSSYTLKGLWSIGQNQFGEWTLTLERESPNGTSVLAAAGNADYVTMVYGSVGQLARTLVGNTLSAIWESAVYETTVNPEMPEEDKPRKKQLKMVYFTCMPLLDDATIKVEYRVDSDQNGAWTEIGTLSTNDAVQFKNTIDASGNQFTAGYNYEFRFTSTEGGQITGYGYKYESLETEF